MAGARLSVPPPKTVYEKPKATKTATGQVKNPLENFPPKTPEMVDAAKTELRDAYSKDFVEYVAKKVQPGVAAAK